MKVQNKMPDTIAPTNPFLDEQAHLSPLTTPEHPEIHPDTLGVLEVEAGDFVAKLAFKDEGFFAKEWHKLHPDMDEDAGIYWHRTEINQKEEDLHEDLLDFQGFLLSLEGQEKDTIGEAIYDSMSSAQKLNVDYKMAETDQAYAAAVDWLVEKSDASLLGAGQQEGSEHALRFADHDQKLLNFLQHHNDYTKQRQQSPEFLENVHKHRMVWVEGVKRGCDQGWLQRSAVDRLTQAGEVKAYEGDHFSTYMNERAGYHWPGSSQIVVGRHNPDAVPHELNHALLGDRSSQKTKEELTALDEMWIDEAITEHIAIIFAKKDSGNIEEFDLAIGEYKPERALLYGLITSAQERGIDIKMADFTCAYSAVGEDRQDQIEKINEKISQIFSGMQSAKTFLADIQQTINLSVNREEFHPSVSGRSRVELMTAILKHELDEIIATHYPARAAV